MMAKVLSVLLALIFLVSGGLKLAGAEFELVAFERWGYPLWFMYLTGAIEVAGGIGLLVPRLSALAATCLGMLMMVAIATHVVHAEWGMLLIALAIFSAAGLRAWIGRRQLRALLPL